MTRDRSTVMWLERLTTLSDMMISDKIVSGSLGKTKSCGKTTAKVWGIWLSTSLISTVVHGGWVVQSWTTLIYLQKQTPRGLRVVQGVLMIDLDGRWCMGWVNLEDQESRSVGFRRCGKLEWGFEIKLFASQTLAANSNTRCIWINRLFSLHLSILINWGFADKAVVWQTRSRRHSWQERRL